MNELFVSIYHLTSMVQHKMITAVIFPVLAFHWDSIVLCTLAHEVACHESTSGFM